jgi:hypothetical protein
MTFDQSGFDVRCEWGDNGVLQLAPVSDVVIIVTETAEDLPFVPSFPSFP